MNFDRWGLYDVHKSLEALGYPRVAVMPHPLFMHIVPKMLGFGWRGDCLIFEGTAIYSERSRCFDAAFARGRKLWIGKDL